MEVFYRPVDDDCEWKIFVWCPNRHAAEGWPQWTNRARHCRGTVFVKHGNGPGSRRHGWTVGDDQSRRSLPVVRANSPVENQERKGVVVVKRRKAAWGERVGLGWTVVARMIRRECSKVPKRPRSPRRLGRASNAARMSRF